MTVARFVQLGAGDLRRSIHCHEEVQLAFLGTDLSDIDMEVTNGIALERLPGRLVASDLRQTTDPM